jgi:3-hydroxybutyrate dehydrogenase
MMLLQNKVAVITGAASGIGKNIAMTYASQGAKVVIADLNQQAADDTAMEINRNGGAAMGISMDVANEAQVDQGIEKVVDSYGGVDILVSNAGIQHIDAVDQLSYENWRKIITVHLDGAFLTSRACLRDMYKRKQGGSIIFMGSVHSKLASRLKAPYVAAKHALLGLCKVIAKEGAAHGVRANVICPGFVRTPLVDKQIPEQAKVLGISEEDVIKKVMLCDTVDGEFTTVQDVAQVALLFAAFKTNALTGQSLIVSHGWFME